MLARLLAMRFFQSANVLGVMLTLYYRAHGLDYTEILSLEIVLSVAMAAVAAPLGLWAGRHGRVLVLKCGNLVFILGAIWFLGSRAYWQFVVADVLYGIGLAWQSGADIALLAPGGARAFAQYRAVGSAAGMAASLVAGAVLETRGMHALVVLNVAMAVLAGAAIVTFRGDSPRRTVATTRPQVSAQRRGPR